VSTLDLSRWQFGITTVYHATFKDMAGMLARSRISAFPVIDDESRVVGVVSEADMLARLACTGRHGHLSGRGQAHEDADGLTAGGLMTSPAVVIGQDEAVPEAARVMYGKRVKRLPVVSVGGHLVGIVSRADVLSVYSRPDKDIRVEVANGVILQRFLADPLGLTIDVRDGIVTLAGRPETGEVGAQIVAAVRHVEGVVAVRDRLYYSGRARVPIA
jgi:CBS domain-containing protein